jgi:hypothetical protein
MSKEEQPMRTHVFLLLLLLSALAASAHGQPEAEACTAITAQAAKIAFRKQSVGRASFCLPAELEPVGGKCYEGGCGQFRSPRFLVTVDFDVAAWRPTSDRYLPSYKEEFSTVDGKSQWIWHFEERGKQFPDVFGTLVKVKNDKYGFGLYFSSTELGHKDLARIVFQSIRFLPKSN